MIHLVAKKLTMALSRRLQYDDVKRQWLQYGMETFLGKLFNGILLFVIALFLGRLLETLVFVCVFSLLRKFTGGYHMKNDTICSIVSVILSFLVVFLAVRLDNLLTAVLSFFFAVLGAITINMLAPVNHPQLHLTEEESILLQKKATRTAVIAVSVFFVLMLFFPYRYSIIGNIAIMCVAVLIILAKLFEQEEECDDAEEEFLH